MVKTVSATKFAELIQKDIIDRKKDYDSFKNKSLRTFIKKRFVIFNPFNKIKYRC